MKRFPKLDLAELCCEDPLTQPGGIERSLNEFAAHLKEKPMVERSIDWRAYVNRLVPCFGCGRLGLPRKGKLVPTGWKMLYQPHPEGVPGLHVCSQDCNDAVRLAMMAGPVTAPLSLPEPGKIMLPAEVREAMEAEVRQDLEVQHARLAQPVDSDTAEGEACGGDCPEAPAGPPGPRPALCDVEEPERGDEGDLDGAG